MITEKLGIPDNIIESAYKIWEVNIESLEKNYEELVKDGSLIFSISNIKIGDFKVNKVLVKFNLNDSERTDEPVLVGMSLLSSAEKNDDENIDFIKYKEPKELRIVVNIFKGENNDKNDLLDFIVNEKIKFISSFAHELKHAYDFKKKPIHNIKSEMEYIDMNTMSLGSPTFDRFLYYLYLSHITEILVKSTELGAEIKMSNINKKQFKEFLSNSRVYIDFKSMSEYNIDDFYKGLKEEIESIVDFLIEYDQKVGTTDENINLFLSMLINMIMNTKVDTLNKHLSNINPILLAINSDKIDDIFNSLKKMANKYENNPNKFFEKQIKLINFTGKRNLKKIIKLYDIIEEDPIKIHNNINRRISKFNQFKDGK